MAKEKKEIEYSKETDDVLVAIVELVKDVRAKKPISQLAGENLQNLINAVGGADQIPDEEKDRKVFLQTIGYRTGELADALLGGSSE